MPITDGPEYQTPLAIGPVDTTHTVSAADALLDQLLGQQPRDAYPSDPIAAVDAAQLAELRHRFRVNRMGATREWDQLTPDQRATATRRAWDWLTATHLED